MRKLLLIISLSFFLVSEAQTTILKEDYVRGNKPVNYTYLRKSKKIVIEKGKRIGGLIAGSKTTGIFMYDLDGKKSTIIENANLYSTQFSNTEKTLRVHDITGSIFKPLEIYFVNNKFSKSYSMIESDAYAKQFPYYNNFNDKYTFKLINQKNSQKIDYQNDVLRIQKVDNITRKRKISKFIKPNVDRLIGPGYVQPSKKLGLNLLFIEDNIDFITKSITSDYSTTTLYKTSYSPITDSIVGDISFEVKLTDGKTLVYSNNGGGFTDTYPNNDLPFFNDDLSINSFIIDKETGDIFIYGLYGDKVFKLNDEANPKGYYVFKFDKNGKKIWESVNAIDDKKFNKDHYMYFTDTSLSVINNKLCFYAFINEHAEFVHYGIIDKETGKEEKSNKVVFHEIKSSFKTGSEFFKLDFNIENVKELNDKRFDIEGIIAYDLHPKFAEYVKSAVSKNNLHFSTVFTDIGLIVVETDNKTYYKATHFKE